MVGPFDVIMTMWVFSIQAGKTQGICLKILKKPVLRRESTINTGTILKIERCEGAAAPCAHDILTFGVNFSWWTGKRDEYSIFLWWLWNQFYFHAEKLMPFHPHTRRWTCTSRIKERQHINLVEDLAEQGALYFPTTLGCGSRCVFWYSVFMLKYLNSNIPVNAKKWVDWGNSG